MCEFDTALGPLAVVLVGALFVGSIETVFAGEVNPPPARGGGVRTLEAGRGTEFERGAELGRFNMGSTVVLLVGHDGTALQRALRARQHAAPRPGPRAGRMSAPASGDWQPTARLDVLRLRATLLQRVRDYFAATGALEVETPVMVGAAVTDVHLESLEVRRADGTRAGFLQTSPEYAMKRLLCAGAPDLFQVARVFREGERGRNHNPEFTMVEWYRLGMDHLALMDDVESLLRALLEPLRAVGPTRVVTYAAAFRESLGCDPLESTAGELEACLRARGIDVPAHAGR